MLSDVCLSVAYIGRKSRTERQREIKIGTEGAHVTRDSDTIFKVKRSRSQGQGHIVAASCTACVSFISVVMRITSRCGQGLGRLIRLLGLPVTVGGVPHGRRPIYKPASVVHRV